MQFELSDTIDAPVLQQVPLADYTTIQIGGPAKYLCILKNAEQLIRAILAARNRGLRYQILGQGSNVLFSDEGFDGLVIIYRADQLEVDGNTIWAEAGAPYSRLVELAARKGLAGLSFAAGIPGTIGGALYGNAGAFGRSIGDLLTEAVLISSDGKSRRHVGPEELSLEYRSSSLIRSGELVESMTLELEPGDQGLLWKEIEENIEYRRTRIPPESLPSAGSFFRNLPPEKPGRRRIAAGKILDECGCKGLSVGDAQVYEKHANIIINRGHATSKQVLTLAKEMQRRVREKFGLQLVPEVRIFPHARGNR